jgi:hypothetical protein
VSFLSAVAVSTTIAAGRAAPSPFVVNSEEKSGIYSLGKEVVFTIKAAEGAGAVDLDKVAATITRDGWEKAASPETKRNGNSLVVRFTPEAAG